MTEDTDYAVVTTRSVQHDDPHNHIGRDVAAGEVFFWFTGATYGCVDRSGGGVALSEGGPTENPFFEFPADAIRPMHAATP